MVTLTWNDGQTTQVYQVSDEIYASLEAYLPTMKSNQLVQVTLPGGGTVAQSQLQQTYPSVQAWIMAVIAESVILPALNAVPLPATAALAATASAAQVAATTAMKADIAAAITIQGA